MTTYGQIFYSKQGFFGADVGESDISLTAGLISAIYSMTTETQDQKITELELEQDRSVFRELPGEKLFIITVDKRMDTSDADDLLTVMVERFNQKYGDIVMDGMILSDFEPIVDEIVNEKLWYNTIEKKTSIKDLGVLLALVFGAIYYPFLLLSGQETYVDPLKKALEDNVTALIIQSIVLGLLTIVPIILIVYITKKHSKMKETFRFSKEFLKRPTRGGYSELLPNWFLLFPVFSISLFIASIRFGRGMLFSLQQRALPESFDSIAVFQNGTNALWPLLYVFIFFNLLTWFLLLPLIIGAFTQNLNWRFMKSSWMIIGISLIIFIPAQIISGVPYLKAIGYHPNDLDRYAEESTEVLFLFQVELLGTLFLFLFFFLVGIGMAQLIRQNTGRYPLAFGFGMFTILTVQRLIFYLIFNSGIIIDPVFV